MGALNTVTLSTEKPPRWVAFLLVGKRVSLIVIPTLEVVFWYNTRTQFPPFRNAYSPESQGQL